MKDSNKKIEVVYVDDNEMYGGILEAFFMESKGLKVKVFSSQKDYKNNYERTCGTSFLISDFHMRGELNGLDFVQQEKHLFNYVLVTSFDENACLICHQNGIMFLGKDRVVNYIEGIEVGITC